MEKAKSSYWNKVAVVSFILSILIVIRHNSTMANYVFTDGTAKFLADFVYFLFYGAFSSIAVPMFFVISGFNFYRNFDISKTLEKYKSRFHSLVIPYWAWNVIYLAFCLITSYSFLSRFFIGREKTVLSFGNVIYGIFFHSLCNGHFWFVFDLILFTLLSPLIYYTLKNKYVGLGVIIAFITVYCIIPSFPSGVSIVLHNIDSPVYYLIGAYFGIHYKDLFTRDYSKKLSLVGVFGLVVFGIYNYFDISDKNIKLLMIIIACASLWLAVDMIKEVKLKPFMKMSFFVYAFHGIVSPIVCKLVYLILPKSQWLAIPSFLIALVITYLLVAFTGVLVSKYLPKLNTVLTGSR